MPIPAGTAYWYDLFQPGIAPGAERAGAHLCVVLSNEAVNAATGFVVIAAAARPERKRVSDDVYRVRVLPEDFVPARGFPSLDQPRTFGMEGLRSVPRAVVGRPAGVIDLNRFVAQPAGSYRSFASALTVQFQLPGYTDALAAAGKLSHAFRRPSEFERGAVVRCVVDGRRRLGIIVSNDLANGLSACPSVQLLLLGTPRAGWSVPLESVARLDLTPNLRPLLKDAAAESDRVLEQVTVATDVDRRHVDELIARIFAPLIGTSAAS